MRGPAWKGDPPRGLLRRAGACGVRARNRGGRAGLRGSGGGGDGRVVGSRSVPRQRTEGCSRHGRGRSACRWRRQSRSAGISPVSVSSSENPRPGLRPDEDTADHAPGSRKTCDNPGWSSLCAFESRGSSTRGPGAPTPGPHSLLGTVGHKCGCTHRALQPRVACLAGTTGSARCVEAPRRAKREACAPGSKTPGPPSCECAPERGARLKYPRDVQISSLLGERLHRLAPSRHDAVQCHAHPCSLP